MKILKKYIYFVLLFSYIRIFSADCYTEIHCKHFFKGMPQGCPPTNDLIIRDSYCLSSNDSTKFADWVAYLIDTNTIVGDKTERFYYPDPWLDEAETLEFQDYKNAHKTYKYDKGHLAPLAHFKGNRDAATTNYLSNIAPQKSTLNQNNWRLIEEWERRLVQTFGQLYVMTGPYYDEEYPPLPEADEKHTVPSGFWKIIIIPFEDNDFKVYGFMMSQDTPSKSKIEAFICNVSEIEKKTKLIFFSELDIYEKSLRCNTIDMNWFRKFYK